MTVLTTFPMILRELKTQIATKISDVKMVFDPQLSFETGTKKLRADNKYTGTSQKQYPLLLWNRSVLRFTEQLNQRHRANKPLEIGDASTAEGVEYRACLGEIDFRFAFISPHFEQIEEFEILYKLSEGTTAIKTLDVEIPGLGDTLRYDLSWQDLEDPLVEYEQWYAKTLTGSCKILGWFLIVTGLNVSLIKDIYLDIYGDPTEVLMEELHIS